jgi:hypothetical protein
MFAANAPRLVFAEQFIRDHTRPRRRGRLLCALHIEDVLRHAGLDVVGVSSPDFRFFHFAQSPAMAIWPSSAMAIA